MFEFEIDNRRACGRRVAAGVYAETRLSPFGQPVESFLVCPPKPVDLAEWGLTAVGVQLIEFNGIWHVFDIVGREHYPHVADFVEETHRKGASRRLPRNLDFSKLTPDSRLILIHARATIENYAEYPQPPAISCPKGLHLAQLEEMCAGLWWHDIPVDDLRTEADGSGHFRTIPGGVSYPAHSRPEGVIPEHQHAIFMSLPITNLVVISGRDPKEEKEAEEAFQAASQSGLPVYTEDE
jgi:hypothetical protein